jgi:arsenate reductase (thioredoxin)
MAFQVLFLCTHNSARSILAEATLHALGGERFQAHSAGSAPSGRVQPLAAEIAMQLGFPVASIRSKSWHEFTGELAGNPVGSIDLVVTVCASAHDEVCPYFPGEALKVHWGVDDPSRVAGELATQRAAYQRTQQILQRRIAALVALPVEALARDELAVRLHAIASIT